MTQPVIPVSGEAPATKKTVSISEEFIPLFDDFSAGLATLCRSLTELMRWKDEVLQLLPSGSVTPLAVLSSEVIRSKSYLTSLNYSLSQMLLGSEEEDFSAHESVRRRQQQTPSVVLWTQLAMRLRLHFERKAMLKIAHERAVYERNNLRNLLKKKGLRVRQITVPTLSPFDPEAEVDLPSTLPNIANTNPSPRESSEIVAENALQSVPTLPPLDGVPSQEQPRSISQMSFADGIEYTLPPFAPTTTLSLPRIAPPSREGFVPIGFLPHNELVNFSGEKEHEAPSPESMQKYDFLRDTLLDELHK